MSDSTELNTLSGPDGKYALLVSNCFTDPEGNTTLGVAKTFTLAEFLENFSEGKPPTRRANLKDWIEHYGLERVFKQQQQSGKLRWCFCIRVFKK